MLKSICYLSSYFTNKAWLNLLLPITIKYVLIHFIAEKVCYCEHKDKGSPKNGIMCGYNGGTFTQNGYCQTQEVCSGVAKTDSESKRVKVNQKRTLCTDGRYS